ncbi:hypothetical protein OAP76_00910 [Alphaproteobacteria bacterium]|nr:hypothetical protein [Alphaproteobacteria bacterium]
MNNLINDLIKIDDQIKKVSKKYTNIDKIKDMDKYWEKSEEYIKELIPLQIKKIDRKLRR